MNGKMILSMLLLLVVAAGAQAALPTIDIAGLDGGQHWLWFEAEYFDSADTTWGGGGYASATSVSNANFYSHSTFWHGSPYQTNGTGVVNHNVYVPAAMDSSTRIYLKYGCSPLYNGGFVDIDGVARAAYNLGDYGDGYGKNPEAWVDVEVGALTAGAHELNLGRSTDQWTTHDGFYLAEGEIVVSSTDTVYTALDGGGTNRRLMQAPTAVGSYEINGVVTPAITVAGAASFQCYLNGVAYTPGTAITESGDYQLEVYAWETTDNVYSHSGVNFTLVPEPATITLCLLGSVALCRRRKN